MLTDTHAHLESFQDIKQLLNLAIKNNVNQIIAIGSDLKTSNRAIKIAREFPQIYATAGVHPHEAGKATDRDFAELEKLALSKEVVAIGETGLDYHYLLSPKERQKEVFKKQIALSNKTSKPLIIHSREAMEDTLEIIQSLKPARGCIFHCFSYDHKTAQELAKMGCYISVGGVVTFKNAEGLRKTIKDLPLDNLLLETDSPYLAPEPFRGKTNQPANLFYIAKKIAQLKETSLDEIAKITSDNAKRLFAL